MSIRANAEYLRALGGPGSGPHKGGGSEKAKSAYIASQGAETASNKANSNHGSMLNKDIANLHANAAVIHGIAADAHVAAAQAAKTPTTKHYHNMIAANHRSRADNHFKASGIYSSI